MDAIIRELRVLIVVAMILHVSAGRLQELAVVLTLTIILILLKRDED